MSTCPDWEKLSLPETEALQEGPAKTMYGEWGIDFLLESQNLGPPHMLDYWPAFRPPTESRLTRL